MSLKGEIDRGLVAMSIDFDPGVPEKLETYLALLSRWNKVINLTSVDNPEEMVVMHLLDSVSVQPYLAGTRILDVGSGAGLPGIPLALINADKDFILLDSNGKKVRFMTQVTIDLGLKNVKVIQSRAEDFSGKFDHVICRAFRQTNEFVKACVHLVAPGGSLLAMKGPAEKETAPPPGFRKTVHQLRAPGLAAERYLIELRQ